MALGDGTQWDETNPQQSTEANTIDAYDRDLRIGTRLRMANEHVWPSSQTSSSQAGQHVFITFQAQTVVPTFTSPQIGVLYADSNNNLHYNNGIDIQLTSNGVIQAVPYIKVSEVQSSGVSGQSPAVSGSFQTAILNTKDADTSNISTLSVNQLILPAGTYKVRASMPSYQTGSIQTRLFNVTTSSTLINGTSDVSATSATANCRSFIDGIFTITGVSNISIQYQLGQSHGVNGQAVGFGQEVYTIAIFEKIG